MPFEVAFEKPPAGYAVSNSPAGDTHAEIQVIEFISTEDGQRFIQRLEGFPTEILGMLPKPVRPSTVDHLLAIIRTDGKTTVYLNELPISVRCRSNRSIEAGDHVWRSDISDILGINLGVQIPADAGFLFVFSAGWRKGLVYDFRPLCPDPSPREFDAAVFLSQAFIHLMFQERFSITDKDWESLFRSRWFPFVGLSHQHIEKLLAYVRADWEPDDLIPSIASELQARIDGMLDSWRRHSVFGGHIPLLERAVERFKQEDFRSCTSIIFPRIEGILRTHHLALGSSEPPNSKHLPTSAVSSRIAEERCLLLPLRFKDYLSKDYFRGFAPTDTNADVARNSVGHGVADATKFDLKSALLGLLIVHQLFYFFENVAADTPNEGTAPPEKPPVATH